MRVPQWLSRPVKRAERFWNWGSFAWFLITTGIPVVIAVAGFIAGLDWPYYLGLAGLGELAIGTVILIRRQKRSSVAPAEASVEKATTAAAHPIRTAVDLSNPPPARMPVAPAPSKIPGRLDLQVLLESGERLRKHCPDILLGASLDALTLAMGMPSEPLTSALDVRRWIADVERALSDEPQKLAYFQHEGAGGVGGAVLSAAMMSSSDPDRLAWQMDWRLRNLRRILETTYP